MVRRSSSSAARSAASFWLSALLLAALAFVASAGPPLALKYYTEFKLTPNEFADGAALKTAVANFVNTLQLAHPEHVGVGVARTGVVLAQGQTAGGMIAAPQREGK